LFLFFLLKLSPQIVMLSLTPGHAATSVLTGELQELQSSLKLLTKDVLAMDKTASALRNRRERDSGSINCLTRVILLDPISAFGFGSGYR